MGDRTRGANMISKPKLIIAPEHAQAPTPTFEQRQGYRDRGGAIIPEREAARMTVKELIKMMGDKHVDHPDFVASKEPVQPVDNIMLRRRYTEDAEGSNSFWWHIKWLFKWAMR